MFEMTAEQQQAFQAATHGTAATTFCHVILYCIGVAATIWLILVFIGTMKNKERSVYDSVYEFAFGVGIYIAIGTVIYYV